MGQIRPGRISRGEGDRRLQRRVISGASSKAPGRDFPLRRFAFWKSVEQNAVSSLRTQGPITTGVNCCRRYLLQCHTDKTRRMGPRARGRRELSPERALRVHIQRIDRLARSNEKQVGLEYQEAKVGEEIGRGG